jgi:elongation factor P
MIAELRLALRRAGCFPPSLHVARIPSLTPNPIGAFLVKSNDLRPGMALRMDGQLYVITKVEHRTPGNLRAFIQVKIKRVSDGNVIERRLSSGEEVDSVDLDRRQAEYLYSDSTGPVFMDSESYDQFNLDKELVGDSMVYLKPNTQIIVLWCEGKPVTVELPKTVDLVVTETQPEIKGATATNQLKEATLETGLKTRVPGFIKQGELVRINTEDGSYQSRA